MLIFDRCYGNEKITEPVIIELINCPSIQRLKGIHQQGMPKEYYHTPVFSRFEHSLGVLILLRRLGANLDEQVAGLIHDVSHTSFSHVIDWIMVDPSKEDYQDNTFLEFIKKSEIPSIIGKYELEMDRFIDLDKFSLLEAESPKLCADRIDYCLRELISWRKKEVINFIANDLTSYNGQIVFRTEKSAKQFGKEYIALQKNVWGGNESRARYYILSNILKISMGMGHITLEDFYKKNDKEILGLISKIENYEISEGLRKLKHGFNFVESEEGIELFNKFRYVDPEVIVDKKIKRLSEISLEYSLLLE